MWEEFLSRTLAEMLQLLHKVYQRVTRVSGSSLCNKQLCTALCVCDVAVPREGNLSEYFLYFVL